MTNTKRTTIAAITISIVLSISSAKGITLPKSDRLLPPETIVMVDIDNFSKIEEQFKKTNLYRFYKDPTMEVFFKNTKEKFLEKIKERDKDEILKSIIDSDITPEGRLTFALVLNKEALDMNEPIALFITQWGENIDKIKEIVDKAVNKAVDEGSHLKTERFQEVEIKTITAKDSERLKYGFSSILNYSYLDDCVIGSESIDLLKFTIAHIKDATSPTLSADNDYSDTIRGLGPDHDIDFYVNIKQLIKTAITEDTSGQAQTTITNLGFDNVAGLGCSIGIARTAGSSYLGKTLLKINGTKKGICRMLETDSAAIKAPKFVWPSAYAISFINLDIKNAFTELANVLNSFGPMYASFLYIPLVPPGPQGEPGVHLKADVIDHLGSQIIVAQSLKKPFSKEPVPVEYIVAMAVNDRSSLEKSLSTFHEKVIASGKPDAKKDLLGYTIYLLEVTSLPFFRPGPTPMQGPGESAPADVTLPTLAFTITDTHLIFGTDSTVESAIRTLNSTESINSVKWFNTAKSAVPSVAGMAGLEDSKAAVEYFWWMMKQFGSSEIKEGVHSIAPGPGLIFSKSGLFDATLLPEFDSVSKYFGLSVSYLISRPDGFYMEFKDINPIGN